VNEKQKKKKKEKKFPIIRLSFDFNREKHTFDVHLREYVDLRCDDFEVHIKQIGINRDNHFHQHHLQREFEGNNLRRCTSLK
jgi:hypothetical protein